jgi:hypothetical protein
MLQKEMMPLDELFKNCMAITVGSTDLHSMEASCMKINDEKKSGKKKSGTWCLGYI